MPQFKPQAPSKAPAPATKSQINQPVNNFAGNLPLLAPLTPQQVLRLQRVVGNRAVSHLLAARIQRETFTQPGDDKNIEYDSETSRLLTEGPHVLTKPKTLYESPDKSSRHLNELKGETPFKLLAGPTKVGLYSWAYISVTIDTEQVKGYINTKKAYGELTHVALPADRGIMAPDGPSVEDIQQNLFGDCFLLAPLLSLTRRQPAFVKSNLFLTDPTRYSATYQVAFFHIEEATPPRQDTVTVNSTLLQWQKHNYGSQGSWNWPAIVEKAYAVWPGRHTDKGLASGNTEMVMAELTGGSYKQLAPTTSDLSPLSKQHLPEGGERALEATRKNAIIRAVTDNKLVTVSTRRDPPQEWVDANAKEGAGHAGEQKIGGIAFGHAYELFNATETEIHMRNPWGNYARRNGRVDKNAAESILTWDEFLMVCDRVNLPAGYTVGTDVPS